MYLLSFLVALAAMEVLVLLSWDASVRRLYRRVSTGEFCLDDADRARLLALEGNEAGMLRDLRALFAFGVAGVLPRGYDRLWLLRQMADWAGSFEDDFVDLDESGLTGFAAPSGGPRTGCALGCLAHGLGALLLLLYGIQWLADDAGQTVGVALALLVYAIHAIHRERELATRYLVPALRSLCVVERSEPSSALPAADRSERGYAPPDSQG